MGTSNSRQLNVEGWRGDDPATENEESGHESKHQNEGVWLVAALSGAVLLFITHSAAAQSNDTTPTVIANGPGFTPWAILISALFGAVTAIVVVAKQRITAHKQAAIRLLLLLKTDGDYKQDEEVFAALAKQDDLLKILDATSSAELKDRLAVLNYSIFSRYFVLPSDRTSSTRMYARLSSVIA